MLKVISSQTSSGFPIDFVGSLTYDPINKGIWIGANQGLYFYEPETGTISAPLADKVAENIHGCIGSIIDKEGKLWIGCLEVNKENIYIQSIKIDGKPYDKTYLTHEQIMSGATVEFEMSNTPKAIGVIFEDKNP